MEENKIRGFFSRLDRSVFIENEYKKYADIDKPLPIGYEQTISQPTLVLDMTLRLEPDKDCTVLEIGTGSGYQTAFLAEFAHTVYTVEIVPELIKKAEKRLDGLGYRNIRYKTGDGSDGWPEFAPYDRIITTAAAGSMPNELIRQLKPGGRIVAPVGPPGYQDLFVITKDKNGTVDMDPIEKVAFVEMKGKYGWNRE